MFDEYKKTMNAITISLLIPALLLFISCAASCSVNDTSSIVCFFGFICLGIFSLFVFIINDQNHFNSIITTKNLNPINVLIFFYSVFTIMYTAGTIILFIFSCIYNDIKTILAFLFMMTFFIYICIDVKIIKIKYKIKNSFTVATQKETEQLLKNVCSSAPAEKLDNLILTVGKKFFIDYYFQLKKWDEIDISDLIGNNIPADIKSKRIIAAKQIFNLNLNIVALKQISSLSEDIIDKGTIHKAKTILNQEIASLKRHTEVKPTESNAHENQSETHNNQNKISDNNEENIKMDDTIAKQYFDQLNLKEGQIIDVSSRHELLNLIFKVNLDCQKSSRWVYKKGLIVWMVRIDGQERGGWRNFKTNDTIFQINVHEKKLYGNEEIRNLMLSEPYRIIFEIVTINEKTCFVVKGLYKCDIQNSNPDTVQILNKI